MTHPSGYRIKPAKCKQITCLTVTLICALWSWGGGVSYATAEDIPDNQQSEMQIRGSGAGPESEISLIVGKGQTLKTKSDKNGNFQFKGLGYYSFVPLDFSLSFPAYSTKMMNVSPSRFSFEIDPRGSMLKIQGKMSPAGTIAMNVDGMESRTEMAGLYGDVELQAITPLGFADGTSSIVTSIIDMGSTCCPKMKVPATPIQLAITSLSRPATPPPKNNNVQPVYTAPVEKPAPQKQIENQDKPKPGDMITPDNSPPATQPEQPKLPYLVTGEAEIQGEPIVSTLTGAIGFSSADYDNTWVGGVKKLTDQIRGAIAARTAMIGAFLDGRSTNASLATQQKLNAQTIKDYNISDSICKFGTLSRGMAGSESMVNANKLAFGKIFFDRGAQAQGTLYSSAVSGMLDNILDFKAKYCEVSDNNDGLDGFCKVTKTTPDLFFNRDTDFTRVFETPMTLDVNFTDSTVTDDEEKIIALFQNLSLRDPNLNLANNTSADLEQETQDTHQQLVTRQLVGNTFANLIAMKAKGTAQSATYMNNVLAKLGVSSANATRLISSNPSYFAQMEILTKKLYQDPSFYANLYDSPANVDRQKVAMKAISLIQDRDLLESLRRREMLLSELLELRLRKTDQMNNQAGSTSD